MKHISGKGIISSTAWEAILAGQPCTKSPTKEHYAKTEDDWVVCRYCGVVLVDLLEETVEQRKREFHLCGR